MNSFEGSSPLQCLFNMFTRLQNMDPYRPVLNVHYRAADSHMLRLSSESKCMGVSDGISGFTWLDSLLLTKADN